VLHARLESQLLQVLTERDNTPQPDACLCLKPGRGGRTRISPKKYLMGAPELIAEIAASSASIDLNDPSDHWLNRKNCCVPEIRLVTVFRPSMTTGPGELVVQTAGETRFVVDCNVNPV